MLVCRCMGTFIISHSHTLQAQCWSHSGVSIGGDAGRKVDQTDLPHTFQALVPYPHTRCQEPTQSLFNMEPFQLNMHLSLHLYQLQCGIQAHLVA